MVEENEIEHDEKIEVENIPPATTRSNLPLIITLVALTIYFAFQTVQLVSERGTLTQVKTNQDAAIQAAQKVQTQFKNLVTKTGQLAAQGHAGAKMVMEELQKRGFGFATETAPSEETKSPDSGSPAKSESKPAK